MGFLAEAALVMNTRMGGLPWVARTQLDYARALLERGQLRDPERARDLLASCDATFGQLGMEQCASDAAAPDLHGILMGGAAIHTGS